MAHIEINHRISQQLLFEIIVQVESSTAFKEALQQALNQQFDLANADLQLRELNNLSAQNAKLQQASFGQSNLIRANFSGADLRGTDFFGCNLTGANFTDARMSMETNFEGAILDDVIGF